MNKKEIYNRVTIVANYPLGFVRTYEFTSRSKTLALLKSMWRMTIVGLKLRSKYHWVRNELYVDVVRQIHI